MNLIGRFFVVGSPETQGATKCTTRNQVRIFSVVKYIEASDVTLTTF